MLRPRGNIFAGARTPCVGPCEPLQSMASSNGLTIARSTHRACAWANNGWIARRGARRFPAAAVRAASSSTTGHGRSGLTWSGVTGDTPPQSLMPAAISRSSAPGARLGGAWMLACAPRISRATAIVHNNSTSLASGTSAMRVPGLARKFWMMTSWIWPYWSLSARSASSASMRSRRVSPIPMRMPLVNGTCAAPAAAIVARRTEGRLSGEP